MRGQPGRVNGTVSGLVTAPDGAPVAAADVLMTGADGLARETTTATDGSFSIRELPSGTYRLEVSATGFARYRNAGVVAAVGREVQVTVSLSVAGSIQTVNVSANQNLLDLTQSSSVANIDRDRIEELPVPSRNYLAFVLLAPQIAAANPAIAQQTQSHADGGFSFDGIRPSSNAIYIDGVDDDDEYTGSSRTELSPEARSSRKRQRRPRLTLYAIDVGDRQGQPHRCCGLPR